MLAAVQKGTFSYLLGQTFFSTRLGVEQLNSKTTFYIISVFSNFRWRFFFIKEEVFVYNNNLKKHLNLLKEAVVCIFALSSLYFYFYPEC